MTDQQPNLKVRNTTKNFEKSQVGSIENDAVVLMSDTSYEPDQDDFNQVQMQLNEIEKEIQKAREQSIQFQNQNSQNKSQKNEKSDQIENNNFYNMKFENQQSENLRNAKNSDKTNKDQQEMSASKRNKKEILYIQQQEKKFEEEVRERDLQQKIQQFVESEKEYERKRLERENLMKLSGIEQEPSSAQISDNQMRQIDYVIQQNRKIEQQKQKQRMQDDAQLNEINEQLKIKMNEQQLLSKQMEQNKLQQFKQKYLAYQQLSGPQKEEIQKNQYEEQQRKKLEELQRKYKEEQERQQKAEQQRKILLEQQKKQLAEQQMKLFEQQQKIQMAEQQKVLHAEQIKRQQQEQQNKLISQQQTSQQQNLQIKQINNDEQTPNKYSSLSPNKTVILTPHTEDKYPEYKFGLNLDQNEKDYTKYQFNDKGPQFRFRSYLDQFDILSKKWEKEEEEEMRQLEKKECNLENKKKNSYKYPLSTQQKQQTIKEGLLRKQDDKLYQNHRDNSHIRENENINPSRYEYQINSNQKQIQNKQSNINRLSTDGIQLNIEEQNLYLMQNNTNPTAQQRIQLNQQQMRINSPRGNDAKQNQLLRSSSQEQKSKLYSPSYVQEQQQQQKQQYMQSNSIIQTPPSQNKQQPLIINSQSQSPYSPQKKQQNKPASQSSTPYTPIKVTKINNPPFKIHPPKMVQSPFSSSQLLSQSKLYVPYQPITNLFYSPTNQSNIYTNNKQPINDKQQKSEVDYNKDQGWEYELDTNIILQEQQFLSDLKNESKFNINNQQEPNQLDSNDEKRNILQQIQNMKIIQQHQEEQFNKNSKLIQQLQQQQQQQINTQQDNEIESAYPLNILNADEQMRRLSVERVQSQFIDSKLLQGNNNQFAADQSQVQNESIAQLKIKENEIQSQQQNLQNIYKQEQETKKQKERMDSIKSQLDQQQKMQQLKELDQKKKLIELQKQGLIDEGYQMVQIDEDDSKYVKGYVTVKIIEINNLPPIDIGIISFLFVLIQFGDEKKKTKSVIHSSNIKYNQEISFKFDPNKMQQRKISVEIWESTTEGEDGLIGSLQLPV